MEIRIRTYDEISSERVRVEVAPGQRATIEIVDGEVSTGRLSDRLYTAAEVGDAQASEAELVAGPLRRRIAELERALAASVNRENRLESDEAERAAEHRRSLAARDHLLSAATTRMNAVREILLATAVNRARDEIVTSKGAVLADAIGNALHALEG